MKRALIFALVLIALVLFAVLRSREPQSTSLAPPAAASSTSLGEVGGSLEDSNSAQAASRSSLSADSQAPGEVEPSSLPASEQALVRVKVLYAGTRSPVNGAHVKLRPQEVEATDAAGVAEMKMPRSATLGLLRIDPGETGDLFVPYAHTYDEPLDASRIDLEVLVDRGADLHGIVRDATTGWPIAGAQINYRGFGHHTRVVSGEDGSFVCTALLVNSNNPCLLTVELEGYPGNVIKPKATDLEPGAAPLVVLLEPGIVVSGRVLDPNRKPVAKVHLQLYTPASTTAWSDELGHFEFRGVRSTEHASISAQSLAWASQPILMKSFDLGALRASRFDIELEVQSAIEVHVIAELPDGSELPPGSFDVDSSDSALRNVGILAPPILPGNAQGHLILRGDELEIRVAARATATGDRRAILRGSTRVHTDASTTSPLEVRIRLGEAAMLEIPEAPAGAGSLELDEEAQLRGALDVQVLDEESGQPIEGENRVLFYLNPAQPEYRGLSPGPGGWVRIWQRIGTRQGFAGLLGGSVKQVTLTIPRTGYAKSEWRVRTKP